MPTAEFDDVAQTYQDDVVKNLGSLAKYRDSSLSYKCEYLKYFLQREPEGVLHFGCVIGLNTPYLKRYFPKTNLFGCDISPESIEIASLNNYHCRFSVINAVEDLNQFKEQNIDVVFAACVFHHIPLIEHELWVCGLHDILNNGGYLVIYEHNMKNPLTARIVKRSKMDEGATMLSASYWKPLLCRKFDKADVRLNYTYFFPWRNRFLNSIEHLLRFVPLGAQYCVYAKREQVG